MTRRALLRLLSGSAIALLTAGAATAAEPINAPGGLAIGGYDVVAYFTPGKPMRGDPQFAFVFQGVTFRFVSADNRAQFIADPTRYLPAYGGYSALGVANGRLVPANSEVFAIIDGRLFLNAAKEVHSQWLRNPGRYIQAADEKWPGLTGRY